MKFCTCIFGLGSFFLGSGLVFAGDLELQWEGGVLGGDLTYSASGDTGEAFVLVPAIAPLAFPVLCGTGQICTLNVDLSLTGTWEAGFVGIGEVTYVLPANPGLAGVSLHAQAFTFPGQVNVVDEVSNVVEFAMGSQGETHAAAGLMTIARRYATATTLGDGTVLISGGHRPTSPPTNLNTWELFDPQTQSFTAGAGMMPQRRARHTATLLPDGRVLLLGGVTVGGNVSRTGVIYDPVTDSFSSTADMSDRRVLHTATLLADGRVFVSGGSSAFTQTHPLGYPSSLLGSINTSNEVYDPGTDTWTAAPSFFSGRTAHTATLFSDGTVVIAGGVLATQPLRTVTGACTLYRPVTNDFVGFAPLPEAKAFHGAVATASDQAFLSGGANIDFQTEALTGSSTTHYYTQGPGWVSGVPMPTGPIIFPGKKRCFPENDGGGSNQYVPALGLGSLDLLSGTAVANADVLLAEDPVLGFSDIGDLTPGRIGGTFAVIDDGLRLLFIGATGMADLSADLFIVP